MIAKILSTASVRRRLISGWRGGIWAGPGSIRRGVAKYATMTAGLALVAVWAGPATTVAFAVKSIHEARSAPSIRHLVISPALAESGDALNRVYVVNSSLVTGQVPVLSLSYDFVPRTDHGQTITARGDVFPARLIVVDGEGNISEIFSNTPRNDSRYYSLTVRQGSQSGGGYPLTEEVLEQYNGLLDELDWDFIGRVYSRQ